MRRRSAEEVRARVVAGAAACYRDLGVAGTSVDDLVRASGVARSTLYRHVGDRNEVLLAVVLDEIDELRTQLLLRVGEQASVVELLLDGVLHAVDLVRERPVLHELLVSPSLLADEVSEEAMVALVSRLLDFVEPLFEAHHGSLRADLDADVAVEFLVRTIRSLAAFPTITGRSTDEWRRYLRHTLVPVFVPDERVRR